MILLSSIINEFEDRYLSKYETLILPGHRRAPQVMKKRGTEHALRTRAECVDDDCHNSTFIPRSCAHRNCPHCQCQPQSPC